MNLDILPVYYFGTPVISESERYVIELNGLNEPLTFLNPTDAGNNAGTEYLKGNGQDILLLNALSTEQIDLLDTYLADMEKRTGKPAEQMNTEEVKSLLLFLENNHFDDRYSSDLAYKKQNLIHKKNRIFLRRGKKCKAVCIPTGSVYADGMKTQQANTSDALFIVDENKNGRITNVAKDYRPIQPKEEIISYQQCLELYSQNNSDK